MATLADEVDLPESDDTFPGLSPRFLLLADLEDNEVIRLQAPLYLDASARYVQLISSNTPFYINGVKVWSSAPIHIYRSRRCRQLHVEPEHDLGSEFVHGWNKMPTELNMRIIAFNVVHIDGITFDEAFTGTHLRCATSYSGLLRTAPEITSLARTVYYNENIFRLSIDRVPRVHPRVPAMLLRIRRPYLAYPNRNNNLLIRFLELSVRTNFLSSDLIQKLANGSYGFENLRSLQLVIPGAYNAVQHVDEFLSVAKKPTRFGCAGSVQFIPTAEANKKDRHHADTICELSRPWFVFGCNKSKRGVIAEREDIDEATD